MYVEGEGHVDSVELVIGVCLGGIDWRRLHV
jgi:hypothetical protein